MTGLNSVTSLGPMFERQLAAILAETVEFPLQIVTIRDVIDELERLGVKVWLSGGCLRDALIGRTARDVDLTVSCHVSHLHDIMAERYGPAGVLIFNPAFGTLRFGKSDTCYIDFSMLRDAADVVGHRHFKDVIYGLGSSLDADARNRDFPFNALYWRGGLIDPTGRGVREALASEMSICQDHRKSAIDPRLCFRILYFAYLGFRPMADAKAYLAVNINSDIEAMRETLPSWLHELTRGVAAAKQGVQSLAACFGASPENIAHLGRAMRDLDINFRSYLHPEPRTEISFK